MPPAENISLKPYNSFGVDVKAKQFAVFLNAEELQELLTANAKQEKLVLGGGSNVLFTQDFEGLVLKNEIKGIELIKEDAHHVYVKAGAGENWHQFVMYCVKRGWGGVENLSLIPGNVGASPMQNIGAYGVEIKEVIDELEAYHIKDKKQYTFSANDCEFGYRDSVFKKKFRNEFVILNVTYRLNKIHKYNTSYGAVEQELARMNVKKLSIHAISQAVINIRSSKLPDPAAIGNAGSFFKNPTVPNAKFNQLKLKHPNIIGFDTGNGSYKLAAGWLIEQCGPRDAVSWKGYRKGDAGCHAKQALVLVNYGAATGKEINALSEEILQSVNRKFGVELEREVNII